MHPDPIAAFARKLGWESTRRRLLGVTTGTASAAFIELLEGEHASAADKKKRRRRRRRRRQRRRDQCVPITPPFSESAGSCGSSNDCCEGGTCCTFNDVGGPESKCFDLLTHTTACGLTCETVVNCFNSGQICVNGVCVNP